MPFLRYLFTLLYIAYISYDLAWLSFFTSHGFAIGRRADCGVMAGVVEFIQESTKRSVKG